MNVDVSRERRARAGHLGGSTKAGVLLAASVLVLGLGLVGIAPAARAAHAPAAAAPAGPPPTAGVPWSALSAGPQHLLKGV
ncbi:MAG: hypothetical protein ACK53C_17975, partial [Pseudomonadota bacterium]